MLRIGLGAPQSSSARAEAGPKMRGAPSSHDAELQTQSKAGGAATRGASRDARHGEDSRRRRIAAARLLDLGRLRRWCAAAFGSGHTGGIRADAAWRHAARVPRCLAAWS